jgi:hypothetical protein
MVVIDWGMPYVDPIPELKRQAAAALVPLMIGNAHDVAAIIGTDQPRVSDIRRGRLERCSLETLIRYLTRLQCRVALEIAPPRRSYRAANRPQPRSPSGHD